MHVVPGKNITEMQIRCMLLQNQRLGIQHLAPRTPDLEVYPIHLTLANPKF